MTDRITAFTVTLSEPIRDDDIESTRLAIMHIKNVIKVENIVMSPCCYSAAQRTKLDITERVRKEMWKDVF